MKTQEKLLKKDLKRNSQKLFLRYEVMLKCVQTAITDQDVFFLAVWLLLWNTTEVTLRTGQQQQQQQQRGYICKYG